MILNDDNPLSTPGVGDNQLRILNKHVLELSRIVGKPLNTDPVDAWNYVTLTDDEHGIVSIPVNDLVVTADGIPMTIKSASFKRRPLYAPLTPRDLRILSQIYLTVGNDVVQTEIFDGQEVIVTNPLQNVFPPSMIFQCVKSPTRFSPIIHVNQIGYESHMSKSVMLGYYLGNSGSTDTSGGELNLAYLIGSFPTLLSYNTDVDTYVASSGSFSSRLDVGFEYSPTPYQKVLQASFSDISQSGTWLLQVPDLGVSYPFNIGTGPLLMMARTMALGFINQRCGYNVTKPYSRHEHNKCHSGLNAFIPLPEVNFQSDWNIIRGNSSGGSPPLAVSHSSDVLYPYLRTGSIDVSGGHHDAGDYSKYMMSSGMLIHELVFAVDSIRSCSLYQNLNIPESRTGKSDLLSIAKWEADFMLKMQESDGGFYTLVYPMGSEYENDQSLQGTNFGKVQIVWPKSSFATAIGCGALAEIGSSPTFRSQFGLTIADSYLSASRLAWGFLTSSIKTYGIEGAQQNLRNMPSTPYECPTYAAASMFSAFGESHYFTTMSSWLPDPNSGDAIHWGWQRMPGYYGAAIRNYAFAASSSRRNANELNTVYLNKCKSHITASAEAQLTHSLNNAYGISMPYDNKSYAGGTFGWFFASEQSFELAVGYQIIPKQSYIDAGLSNLNYIAGCNPINICSLSGIGRKRPHVYVSSYQLNDKRILPPNGLFRSSISPGTPFLENYKTTTNTNELNTLVYPIDYTANNKFPFYDRYTDTFNVVDEWTVAPVLGKGLPFSVWMASFTTGSLL